MFFTLRMMQRVPLFASSARCFLLMMLAMAGALSSSPALFAADSPEALKDVGIVEKLGQGVPLQELHFRDEKGQQVQLSKFFHSGKPVLLNLVYYECPSLCNFILNGLVQSLKPLDWSVGQKFEVIEVSINPRENAELAAAKKQAYLSAYGRSSSPEATAQIDGSWHFLTGEEAQIQKLAEAVGFKYKYDEKEKQYAHTAATFVLTPEGKLSRILYGIEHNEKNLKLALLEASDGRIGTIIDRFLLFCYRYDSEMRRYSLVATRVMQAGGAGTLVVFGAYLAIFWNRQRRNGVEAEKGDKS